MSNPVMADHILEHFVEHSESILADNLVGIYLHGSAAMGCYNPAKSDLDLIVVTQSGLTDACKRNYMDMVTELDASLPIGLSVDLHHGGIEMSLVRKDVCKPFLYPTPFELHFSRGHLAWYRRDPDGYIRNMRGTDKDLAAHFTVIRDRGKRLYGQPIETVFGEVPKADYLDSIQNDIAGARAEIVESTMYLTLNLARVLAFETDGLVLSKKEGGEWALRNLPPEYHPLIQLALDDYEGDSAVQYDPASAGRYADYMIELIFDKGDDHR